MRLVDKAIIRVIKHCFTCEKLAQKERTTRSINSSQPRHHSVVRKNKLFGFTQDLSSLVSRIGRTRLIHDVAMLLGVNTRAAGEKQSRTWKNEKEGPRALQVNSTIFFCVTTTGARALNNNIELLADVRYHGGICDVHGTDRVRFGGKLPGRL